MTVVLVLSGVGYAECEFVWSEGEYCGSRRTTKLVPDRKFGEFTEGCKIHDWCYFAAGEQIVSEINSGYLSSISKITRRKRQMKKDCDSALLRLLEEACSGDSNKKKCVKWAKGYYLGVTLMGGKAFDGSIKNAIKCRSGQ